MTLYQPRRVHAVQWDGSDAAYIEIRNLLRHVLAHDPEHLAYDRLRLRFLSGAQRLVIPSEWVVQIEDGAHVWPDEQFRALYKPAEE